MHADEVRIDERTMRALLGRQAPQWADLTVRPLPAAVEGTDHTLFRIGDDLLARMPKIGWAADQAASDARWLPALAPHLPVAVPTPVLVGEPDEGFPYPWSVTRWLPGVSPGPKDRTDVRLAEQLAAFVKALHAIPTGGGPPPKEGGRGTSLARHDDGARAALRALRAFDDGFDVAAAGRAWDACLAGADTDQTVWIHGDLGAGNLLAVDGRLTAVIDWGAVGVTDPAPDLAAAFWTFEGPARARYRELMTPDDETWLRAAGWALLPALTGLDYYRDSAPHLAARARREIRTVIAELGVG